MSKIHIFHHTGLQPGKAHFAQNKVRWIHHKYEGPRVEELRANLKGNQKLKSLINKYQLHSKELGLFADLIPSIKSLSESESGDLGVVLADLFLAKPFYEPRMKSSDPYDPFGILANLAAIERLHQYGGLELPLPVIFRLTQSEQISSRDQKDFAGKCELGEEQKTIDQKALKAINTKIQEALKFYRDKGLQIKERGKINGRDDNFGKLKRSRPYPNSFKDPSSPGYLLSLGGSKAKNNVRDYMSHHFQLALACAKPIVSSNNSAS